MGRNCLREVLRHRSDRLLKVFTSATEGDEEISSLLRASDIPIEKISNDALTTLVGSDSHQSYAGLLRDRDFRELKEFLEAAASEERSLVIMLDALNDPQNFGAILRAAECFGVDAVVWSKNRGASLTPAVTKTSVGASELVPLIPVSNLGDAVRKFKEAGYWIVAADAGTGAQELGSFEVPAKSLVIFGSEGEGLQRLLLENADFTVKIPLSGQIDSLNVSQAVAVFLFHFRR
jgi:23S rRNA (guanosine2251-2'-O)-methyltransferase